MHNYLQAFHSVSNWTTNTPFPNVCSFEAHYGNFGNGLLIWINSMPKPIYWAWPCPSEQDLLSPSVSLSHQETSISLLFFSIRGKTEWKPHHRKLTNLIPWTTALSNSIKLWAMPCRATQYGQVLVESSDKTWSNGEGNGKPLQYSCLENHMNKQKDMTLKDDTYWK